MRASLFGFLAVLLLGGCSLSASDSSLLPAPIDPPSDHGGTLVLRLRVGSSSLQTLAPPISMNFASFDIQATSPSGEVTPYPGHTGFTLELDHLSFGTWTIAVDARNEQATIIGHGETTVEISSENPSANAEILILPVSGTGTLQLTVYWGNTAHPNALADSSLVPMGGGSDLKPVFKVNPQKAFYNNGSIAAGYYLLTIRLSENNVQFWGTAEAVRILAGQITIGDWTTPD